MLIITFCNCLGVFPLPAPKCIGINSKVGRYIKYRLSTVLKRDINNPSGLWNDPSTSCNGMACHGSANWYTTAQLGCKICHSAGSYTSGKTGQSAVFNNNPIQMGTENGNWGNDAGYHGNTPKLAEMKYNMTLETWVYPTDNTADERKVISEHNYQTGGYALVLKKINGTIRAAVQVNVNLGGTYTLHDRSNCGVSWHDIGKYHWADVWDTADCNGLRGAYSSVPIPINQWTHISATFDKNGPDRNGTDGSVGRIRIWVNGIDVTDSSSSLSSCWAQPGTGENNMTPWSDMNKYGSAIKGKDPNPSFHSDPVMNDYNNCADPDNDPCQGIPCYNGQWCANELFIGGFSWGSDYYIGRLDDLKIWNVTKDYAYFNAARNSATSVMALAEGIFGNSQITVYFTGEVFANSNGTGDLTAGDFVLTDSDNGRTITGVSHAAGNNTAVLTLSSPLDTSNDLNVDTIATAASSIFSRNGTAVSTVPVKITGEPADFGCPAGTVSINFNEAPGSGLIKDTDNILYGIVNEPSQTILGDGYLTGDGTNNYTVFYYNNSCLKATTAMTIEASIKPTGIADSPYIKRILSRNANGNYQLSVWKNNTLPVDFPGFVSPAGTASIALWINVVDAHGGNVWKPVLTNYTTCPIVSDHWYKIKAVWNTNKPGGTPGQPFVPADIYIDDEGTDGNGSGQLWSGYANCTNSGQTYSAASRQFYTGDQILANDGAFSIGADISNLLNNVFSGLIDWITWKNTAD